MSCVVIMVSDEEIRLTADGEIHKALTLGLTKIRFCPEFHPRDASTRSNKTLPIFFLK